MSEHRRTRSRRVRRSTALDVEQPTASVAVDPRNGDYLTRKEVAAILHRSVRTLEWWEQRKIGPPVIHFQRMTLYKRSSVDRWLDQHETLYATRLKK